MNKPITSRVQHATDKGMIRQPLLNMGSPVKQKVELKDKATEVNESVKGMQNGKIGVFTNTSSISIPSQFVPGKKKTIKYTDLPLEKREAAKAYNMETYGTHNPTALGLADNTEQDPDTYIPGETSTVSSFGEYKTAIKGDAKKPWHRRQDMRSTKLSTKGVIKTQDKIDELNRKKSELIKKYDTNKDGKLTKKEEARVKSKGFLGIGNDARSLSRAENRITAYGGQLKGAQGSQNASIKQQEQSVRYGNKIDLGERDARLSDVGPAGGGKQTEILSRPKADYTKKFKEIKEDFDKMDLSMETPDIMKRSPYKMTPKSPIMKSFKK